MDSKPFADLVNDSQTAVSVMLAIEAAVSNSFRQDEGLLIVPRSIRITQSEIKRRSNLCLEIFRVLRGDMRWSWQRACDHLGPYLRKSLDGESWEPAARSMWAANTGETL